ncbi:MAG: hypothetical protein Q8L86_02370 [Vicinamibacterales bacterium]|nr:hypothetical protein [Vicinamibacterales bacterium]
MNVRGVLVVALICLLAPPPAATQTTPKLTRAERDALRAVVAAVDAAGTLPHTDPAAWPIHLLRASDGSHYIAFSALLPPESSSAASGTLYVRLATRAAAPTVVAERSAVMEWLQGQRADPLPARAARVVSVPSGEMPVGGASAADRTGGGQSSTALRLVEHQRERARERREDEDRDRRAALEGGATAAPVMYPFEDFDVSAALVPVPGGGGAVRRSVTAGPGDFDLYVGWLPADGGRTPPVVMRRALALPPASANTLTIGSVIVAEEIRALERPPDAQAQSAHPYAIGAMDIVPALDTVFTSDERMAVIFQVINATATAAGKPDVTVAFRIVQDTGAGETLVATLNPQHYHSEVLPPDFDLTRGHPLVVAMAAPLDSLDRGDYRLLVGVSDRLAGRAATTRLDFRIAPSPRGLLREAPAMPLPRFDRQALLTPETLALILDGLLPAAPSPALARAFTIAREQRFIDLLGEEPVAPEETGVRTALRGLALLALGDAPASVAVQLEQALRLEAPAGPVRVLIGTARALESQHRAAAAAWQAALDAGFTTPGLEAAVLLAHLRAGDGPRAAQAATAARARQPADPDVARWHALAALQAGDEATALIVLEGLPASDQMRFLQLQALYAGFVHARGPGASAEGRARFTALARDYIAEGAPHAALVEAWRDMVAAR